MIQAQDAISILMTVRRNDAVGLHASHGSQPVEVNATHVLDDESMRLKEDELLMALTHKPPCSCTAGPTQTAGQPTIESQEGFRYSSERDPE